VKLEFLLHPTECAIGRKFQGHCYKVEEQLRNYQDASAACASSGGLLAAIKTQEQQDFLEVEVLTILVLCTYYVELKLIASANSTLSRNASFMKNTQNFSPFNSMMLFFTRIMLFLNLPPGCMSFFISIMLFFTNMMLWLISLQRFCISYHI